MTSEHSSKEQMAAGYDKVATEYLEWARSRPDGMKHRVEILEKLLNHLGTDQVNGDQARRKLNVLELGCGAGEPATLALAAHPAVGHIFANDFSATQLEMLRENLSKLESGAFSEKVEGAHGDMTKLEYPAGSLDAVLAYYSIIHLTQEEQTQMVSRIHCWLKPGTGHFLCCFGLEESTGATNNNWLGMKAFWSSHGQEKSLKMVTDAGFEVVHREVTHDPQDASFLWVIVKKKPET